NAIDGMLAKEHQMKTPLGNILNELGDVFSDAFLFLPFALIPQYSAVIVIFVVLLAIISEMTGVLGIVIGASRRYDGPMGKSDRAFVFGFLALCGVFHFFHPLFVNSVLGITAALILINIFIRIHRA